MIEIKNTGISFESEDVLREQLIDNAGAESEVVAASDEVMDLSSKLEGMEHLALALGSIDQFKPTDLALAEIAMEMINVGNTLDVSRISTGLESNQLDVSMEGIFDGLKAIAKKIGSALKKMWWGFLKLMGSLEADVKLQVLKLKEMREKLAKRRDTELSINVDEISELLTGSRAKSFSDIIKATEKAYDTFTQSTDVYATFCNKFARMSYLGWQSKGKLSYRVMETAKMALKAVEQSTSDFPLKAPEDDNLNATAASFGQYIAVNLTETIRRANEVGESNYEQEYKQLADIANGVRAHSRKVIHKYAEPTEMQLPKVRELSSMIDGMISFYMDWLRMFKNRMTGYGQVMDAWLASIEAFDWIKVDGLPVGKLARKAAEILMPDYNRLNKAAYNALNLFPPFHGFCKKNFVGLKMVTKEVERLVGKYEKA